MVSFLQSTKPGFMSHGEEKTGGVIKKRAEKKILITVFCLLNIFCLSLFSLMRLSCFAADTIDCGRESQTNHPGSYRYLGGGYLIRIIGIIN